MAIATHRSGWFYVWVGIALAALTAATWAISRLHLQTGELLVALLIATAKATLILLFFMHLREHPTASAVAGLVSLIFVALLISLSLADVLLRFEPTVPPGRVHPHIEPHWPTGEPTIPGHQPSTAPRGR